MTTITKHSPNCTGCELFLEEHPYHPMSLWELDGTAQAATFAKKNKRRTLYQALTGDLDETPADHGEAPQGAKW
jgi:hypothetical protein